MPKPAIVIIPGAWHCPQHYRRLINELVKVGYEAEGVTMPSAGSSPPLPSWDQDAEAVRQVILRYLDAGKDVIAVAHSFGGIAMSEGVKGLGKADREKEGLKGAVVRLIYMAAMAVPEGQSYLDVMQPITPEEEVVSKKKSEDQMKYGGFKSSEDGSLHVDHEMGRQVFYNGCAPADVEDALGLLKSFPPGLLGVPVTYSAFLNFPSTYIVCENDNALDLLWQRRMIAQADGEFTVETCQEGHSPFLSNVGFIVGCVRRGAREAV